jgi:hypothetical protein
MTSISSLPNHYYLFVEFPKSWGHKPCGGCKTGSGTGKVFCDCCNRPMCGWCITSRSESELCMFCKNGGKLPPRFVK